MSLHDHTHLDTAAYDTLVFLLLFLHAHLLLWVTLIPCLRLSAVLHRLLLLGARVAATSSLRVAVARSTTHWVCRLVMRLSVVLVLWLMVLLVIIRRHLRRSLPSCTRLQ